MYEEEEESWSSSAPHLDHRRRSAKPVAVSVTDYRDSYTGSNGRPVEDSGYYDATYDVMRPPSKLLSIAAQNRISALSDDSMQLAYTDSRPTSSYAPTNAHTSDILENQTRRNGVLPSDGSGQPLRNMHERGPSGSRPASRSSSQHPQSSLLSQQNNNAHTSFPSPWATPPLSPSSLPNTSQSPHLTVPSTPASSPPRRPSKTSTPDSKHSQLSLVQSEGEDADAFYVRSTYAQLDMIGVKGDGVDEGVERTRARVGGSRASELRADEALADEDEKTRDLTSKEIELLASLDR